MTSRESSRCIDPVPIMMYITHVSKTIEVHVTLDARDHLLTGEYSLDDKIM